MKYISAFFVFVGGVMFLFFKEYSAAIYFSVTAIWCLLADKAD